MNDVLVFLFSDKYKDALKKIIIFLKILNELARLVIVYIIIFIIEKILQVIRVVKNGF